MAARENEEGTEKHTMRTSCRWTSRSHRRVRTTDGGSQGTTHGYSSVQRRRSIRKRRLDSSISSVPLLGMKRKTRDVQGVSRAPPREASGPALDQQEGGRGVPSCLQGSKAGLEAEGRGLELGTRNKVIHSRFEAVIVLGRGGRGSPS